MTVPESFHKGFRSYLDAGFHTLTFPQEVGGMGSPPRFPWHPQNISMLGNTALTMYCGSITGAMALILPFGSEELKNMFLPKMFDGKWGGTMCLTEPGAGSDVGGSQDQGRQAA